MDLISCRYFQIICTSVVTQLCRVWSLSNTANYKCINEKKNGSINGLIFLYYYFLILNLFYDLGNNMAISMDEEEF